MIRPQLSATAASLLVVLSGCLPYSCRRQAATAIMPSDSLSRELAASVPVDTLRPVWTAGDRLGFPRTVRFGACGSDSIFAADVEQNRIFIFNTAGNPIGEIDSFNIPYIAGVHGDTLAVFSPPELAIDLVVGGEVVSTIQMPDVDRPSASLVYAAYLNGIFYKRIGPDENGFIASVDSAGRLLERYELNGPHWRHAGLLRTWGDTLISLSGFRPVVDVVTPHGSIDTLALRGFDSPMLARSRSFLIDEIDEPPLLSASAAGEGPYLFVMNMRPGWLQIDVFDRQGMLQFRLTQPDRELRRSFFPQDLDVRRRPDGSYAIVVAFSEPEPIVRMFSWDGTSEP